MSASAIGLERVARWGGLALLGVTFGASAMLLRPDQAPLAPGFADEGRRSVAPVERGRLAQLDVEPGDLVHAGAVLARLDPAVLEREIEAR
ncbi:MAG TPA: biotin/lipoyl-binding protein, partial [Myxococcota bacterium]|nr:biotin/lipoyl-binding protein [Myxococcota bacterium]